MAGRDKTFNLQKALTAAQSALRRGDAEAARQGYADVLERFPANRRAQDGLAEAAQAIARAARPELTQGLVDRAIQLHATGKSEEALAEAHLLATAYPDVPLLQNFLAICAHESGRYALALAAARRAVKLKADYPEAHLNLAIALTRAGQREEAANECRTALDQRPDYGAAHMQLGLLEEALGNWRAARTHLERATECSGAGLAAYNNLGTLLNSTGDFDAAKAAFETALGLDPGSAEMHANLAELKTFEPGDPQIAAMEAQLSAGTLPKTEAVKLHFALAKAKEDCGETDAAFGLYLSGNKLRKSLFPYQPAETDAEFAAIRVAFEHGFPPTDLMPQNSASPVPVFIVGLPRSGTTLVEQILASHSAISGAGEQGHMNRLFAPLLDAEHWKSPDRDRFLSILREYQSTLKHTANGTQFITDKMPTNFRWIGFLARLFPDARFIHLSRDPVATSWSMFKRLFNRAGNDFAYDLDDLAAYYGQYRDLMVYWSAALPDQMLEVSYETLTEEPEGEIRRMLAYLGLDWEDSCLAFHKTERVVKTASTRQVRQAMYRGSSEAWRPYADHLAPMIEKLNRPS